MSSTATTTTTPESANNCVGFHSNSFESVQPTRIGTFQRSYSKVFYESDCSTPTSWEFCGLAAEQKRRSSLQNHNINSSLGKRTPNNLNSTLYRQNQQSSPIPNLAMSLLRSVETSQKEIAQADGSRNSTGSSSSGSHRSQDSGFSDSGETKRQQQLLRLSQIHHQSMSNGSQNGVSYRRSKSLNQSQQQLQYLQQENSFSEKHCSDPNRQYHCHNHSHSNCHEYHDLHLSLPVPPLPTSQPPVSVVVNGTPTCFHNCLASEAYNNDCDNGNCVYQEIIVSQPLAAASQAIMSPPCEVDGQCKTYQEGRIIGDPTCCSTPKNSSPTFTPSKMTVMQKIDNFESLNKNINMVRTLDNNNNNNNNSNNSNSSGNETRSSFFSRPPSRIPTPPPTMRIQQQSNNVSTSIQNEQNSQSSSLQGKNSTCKTVIGNHDLNGNVSNEQDPRESSLSLLCRLSPKINDTSNYNSNNNNNDSSQVKLFNKNSPNKWQSLPKGFKRIHVKDNARNKEIIVKSHFDNDAVRLWLHELRVHTEPECFHVLQIKDLNSSLSTNCGNDSDSLNYNSPRQQRSTTSTIPAHLVSAPLLSIRRVESIASLISGEFSRICKYLEFKLNEQVTPLIFSLLEHIEDFIKTLKDSSGYLTKNESHLLNACSDLRMTTLRFCDDFKKDTRPMGLSTLDRSSLTFSGLFDDVTFSGRPDDTKINTEISNSIVNAVVKGVVRIGNQFSQIVDQKLTKDLSTILDVIESGGFGARVALESFSIILNDGGMHLCHLAANIRTVRGLLSCVLETREVTEQVLALRCLATVLCVGEAVKDFDKAGGFEIIADILHDSGFGLVMKHEAIAVLTQVTDPWIDLGIDFTLCNLGIHLEKIIVSLTRLIPTFQNDADSFLLIVAAISNLTFLELSSICLLKSHGTIPLVVKAVQEKSDFYSMFILDHVSTILANMSGAENCLNDIVGSGAIEILVKFLHKSPSPYDSLPEITACERLQQQSAIAISRLATEKRVPEMVLNLGCFQRLVQLAKQEKERNYSDGVLIACLVALRKLVPVCGGQLIEELRAEDLIYPKFFDSFLLFSSRQESCV